MTTATLNPNQLLDTSAAAELLGVTRGTLEQWRSLGRHGIPYVKVGPRCIRYRLSDLQRWMDERVVGVEDN